MKRKTQQSNQSLHPVVRGALLCIGTISVGLGILGVFLPVLPTTPFLLLAAACYAKSSKRFYDWLIHNRVFGTYIRNYREGKGIPVRIKCVTIFFLWVTILFTTIFFLDSVWIKALLLIIAIGVTVHILTIKTLRKKICIKTVSKPVDEK